jgi:hypothetical protein
MMEYSIGVMMTGGMENIENKFNIGVYYLFIGNKG